MSEQTPRKWRRQDQRDRHDRDDGLTSDERDELRRLRRGNARLKQERDLLKRAAAFRSGDRDPVSVYRMISAEEAGTPVSVCCRLLGVSHSGYFADVTYLRTPRPNRVRRNGGTPQPVQMGQRRPAMDG